MTGAASHPYQTYPDRQFWARAVARRSCFDLSDLYKRKFDIGAEDGIATAGSCFAQHISRALARSGYNYLNAEPAPPRLPKSMRTKFGYGMYSARYGNIYTARQLLQLAQRATGAFQPVEPVWLDEASGRAWDPFRPTIEPDGFESAEEALACQERHLAAVKSLLETTDVFIFTLGLTETWVDSRDGAAYPTCPGTAAGTFDAAKHVFRNLDYEEVLEDLRAFIALARTLRPGMRFLFTVSPVPLVASAEDQHVMAATVYSKSVLRAVAGKLQREDDLIDYFPSYELISGIPSRSMFYEPDLRSVNPHGVDWVMSHFFAAHPKLNDAAGSGEPAEEEEVFERDVVCDEEHLNKQAEQASAG
ncbi:MAG: GSCFA domain-containing protein [Pseudomonadota bacterium]